MHTHERAREGELRAGRPVQREPTVGMRSCACREPRPQPSPTAVPSGSQMWPIPRPSCSLEMSKASRGHRGFCNDPNDVSFVSGSCSRPATLAQETAGWSMSSPGVKFASGFCQGTMSLGASQSHSVKQGH